MRTYALFLAALLVRTASLFAQTNYTCTFSANVAMDSVKIKNIASNETKILHYPDNIITLQKFEKTTVPVVKNTMQTRKIANDKVAINVGKATQLNVTMFSIDGTVVTRYTNYMNAGQYVFQIGASAGVYVVMFSTDEQTASVKLSLQENTSTGIFEIENNEPIPFLKSADDIITFYEGDEFEFTGYYKKQTEIKSCTIAEDKEIVFDFGTVEIENGAIKAAFSISANNQVYFSQGNLQYQATTNTWRFAEHQWDFIGTHSVTTDDPRYGGTVEGSDNLMVSPIYNGWIDLFCWGTSGWYSGANQYKPWASCRNNPKDFNVGGTICNSLTGAYAKADWGYYNAISNGGNSARMWRTLTKAELTYLIKERPNASKLRDEATVNEVNGIVILPDNWITPSNITFNPDYGYDKNTYTVSEWARMEANGAVFLPSSADRDHGVRETVDKYGIYWLSTRDGRYDFGNSYAFYFDRNHIYDCYSIFRCLGAAVRVVQDVDLTESHTSGESYENEIQTVTIENGAIKAYFTGEYGKKIYFSKGNLQYQASTNTWRFAEHQYDIIGEDNSNISPTYGGWIDLFGWGTSGWNSGANSYLPHSTSTNESDYFSGDTCDNDFTGKYENVDWGIFNNISNGGNTIGMWRTPTFRDWCYIIYNRTYASCLQGEATINGIPGLVLLPDDWTMPSGMTFNSGYGFDKNTYTVSEWAKMEEYGAVFLPASGSRIGTNLRFVDNKGVYWSASDYDQSKLLYHYVFSFSFDNKSGDTDYSLPHVGASVRLIQDVK